jgi:hypothetical protein
MGKPNIPMAQRGAMTAEAPKTTRKIPTKPSIPLARRDGGLLEALYDFVPVVVLLSNGVESDIVVVLMI